MTPFHAWVILFWMDGFVAGYTASTSPGRVGRGGNARFRTSSTRSPLWTNQRTNQPTDGRTKPLIESLVRD